jgi:hypothetical protein
MRRFILPLLALAFAGCMTSETSRTPSGVPGDGEYSHLLTVDIENTGWYLFDMIPLLCGNPHGVNRCSTVFFHDTLNLQNNLDELTRIVQREGAYTIGSLMSHEVSESVWIFFVSRHAYHTSATLMKTH